jgi:hypothetical protein
METLARVLGAILINAATFACAVRAGCTEVSFCNWVNYVQPPFATSSARLAVSGVNRWHQPTVIGASFGVGDVYVIRIGNDSNVISH